MSRRCLQCRLVKHGCLPAISRPKSPLNPQLATSSTYFAARVASLPTIVNFLGGLTQKRAENMWTLLLRQRTGIDNFPHWHPLCASDFLVARISHHSCDTAAHPKDRDGRWEQKMDHCAGGTLFSMVRRCALMQRYIIRSKLYALRHGLDPLLSAYNKVHKSHLLEADQRTH